MDFFLNAPKIQRIPAADRDADGADIAVPIPRREGYSE
jgi:hypothetical protein